MERCRGHYDRCVHCFPICPRCHGLFTATFSGREEIFAENCSTLRRDRSRDIVTSKLTITANASRERL